MPRPQSIRAFTGPSSASRSAEGRKDWLAAEGYYRQITQSNPGGGWPAWYLFCKRTGHGDAEAVGAFADRALATAADGPGATPPAAIGYFYWLRGDPKKAGPTSARRTTPPPPPRRAPP